MNLVTGGLGFIGNELVRQLLSLDEVAVVDNLNRVAPRIDDIKPSIVFEADITNASGLRDLFCDLRPNVIFHLAAVHFIPECNSDPRRTLQINVEGTQSVLDAANACGARHVVIASSGAIYADSPLPLAENSVVSPTDIYGLSKMFTEQLAALYASNSSAAVTIARLFNNYGPRETNAHIIPEIIEQLRKGDDIFLGNIKPRRDYIHTSDSAKALRLLGQQSANKIRTFNVASGHHASVEELVETIGAILGRNITLHHDPNRLRKVDKLVQVADISSLQAEIKWSPEIDFRTGITDLLKFEGLLP